MGQFWSFERWVSWGVEDCSLAFKRIKPRGQNIGTGSLVFLLQGRNFHVSGTCLLSVTPSVGLVPNPEFHGRGP